MKAIYKFESDCGRMGTLYGLFVAEKDDVANLIASEYEIYFGEVLGKHSQIYGIIYDTEIKIITDEQDIVNRFQVLDMEIGFNPVEMWKEQKEGNN